MASFKSALTVQFVRSVLHYNPDTGVFTWLRPTSNRVRAGDIAGRQEQRGTNTYLRIGIKCECPYAHRLAWFYMTGEWPPDEVDHRDTDGLNNRWANLRLATRAQNNANHRQFNKWGFKGVFQQSCSGRFMAKHADRYLGTFDTPEEASAAYLTEAKRRYGDYARAR